MKYWLIRIGILATLFAGIVGGARATDAVPVIYCTDLFHPHVDPDDHFDLACLYAIPQLNIKVIILDQGRRQQKQPGSVAVQQMNTITGRNVPWEIGLADPLANLEDTGANQAKEYQGGVERILKILTESDRPVSIITVGSVRDVAAAFNRQPDLFHKKVGRLMIFIGEASNPGLIEYNVSLDVQAFRRVMESGLPIYWVPCFDGGLWQNRGRASYWKTTQAELLGEVSKRAMNYFIYALTHSKEDPILFLDRPITSEQASGILGLDRNLWCTAIFGDLADMRIWESNKRFYLADKEDNHGNPVELFRFEDIQCSIDERGVVSTSTAGNLKIKRFRVLNEATYPDIMTQVTARLLASLGK
ncbi:MAG: hypothetical protein GX455_03565 [Phycisphaerae bacterium]|nr:hypothetical protein [Phycisphaerae bacterium]